MRKPNEAAQVAESSSKAGWGSSGNSTASTNSGWGGQSSSGWGSAAPKPAPVPTPAPPAQLENEIPNKSKKSSQGNFKPLKASVAPSKSSGDDAGKGAEKEPEPGGARGSRNGGSNIHFRSFRPNNSQDGVVRNDGPLIRYHDAKIAREPLEMTEQAAPTESVGPPRERWKHLQYKNRDGQQSSGEPAESSNRSRRPDKFKRGRIVSWDATPDEKWASTFTRQPFDSDQARTTQGRNAPPMRRRNDRQASAQVDQYEASGGKRDRNAKGRNQQRNGNDDIDDRVVDKMERREKRKADKRESEASIRRRPSSCPTLSVSAILPVLCVSEPTTLR